MDDIEKLRAEWRIADNAAWKALLALKEAQVRRGLMRELELDGPNGEKLTTWVPSKP